MFLIFTKGTMVRFLKFTLSQPIYSIRLGILIAALQSSGCAMLHTAASAVATDASHATAPQSIDTKTQAEACRRTAIELAAHEKDDHAIAQLERARELDPRIKGVAHLLAVLYDRQGRIDAAEREYVSALKETKNSPDVLNDYGYYLYCRDELARAEEALRDCLEQNENHKTANLNLGLVLAKQGKDEESFAAFKKAVGPAAAQHNLGMLKLRAGRQAEGISHLREAAKRDPSLNSESVLAFVSGSSTIDLIASTGEPVRVDRPTED